jgi:hypothetical protein
MVHLLKQRGGDVEPAARVLVQGRVLDGDGRGVGKCLQQPKLVLCQLGAGDDAEAERAERLPGGAKRQAEEPAGPVEVLDVDGTGGAGLHHLADDLISTRLVDGGAGAADAVGDHRRRRGVAGAAGEAEDGGRFDVEQGDGLLRDEPQDILEIERRGDGAGDALHGAELGDLALEARVGAAVEARVLDPDRQFPGDGLQKGDLVFGKLATLDREEVEDADQDFGLAAAPEHHGHRDLRRIDVLAGGRYGRKRRVFAGVGGGDHPTLRGGAPGDAAARIERQRADRRGIETDRGAQGEDVGRLVVEHDAAGVGAGGVSEDADGGLQPIGEIQVGGSGAVDAV